jgi:hypothetical protein
LVTKPNDTLLAGAPMGRDLSVSCPKCNRKWCLKGHKLITRDSDYISCRCGETLHEWSGTISYTKIQMFDAPAITCLPVHPRCEPGLEDVVPELPAGTALEVTSDFERVNEIACRRVRTTAKESYLVPEAELLVALGERS